MPKVTIRYKQLVEGRKRIYLDYYPSIKHPDTGKPTRREFLDLYIYEKPQNKMEREHNSNTNNLALTVCAQRQISIQQEQYGFLSNLVGNQCFVEYFLQLAENRKGSNEDNWFSALYYLKSFTKGTWRFADISEKKSREFRDYIVKAKSRRNGEALATNTALSYYSKFKAALRQAYKDGLLAIDISSRIESIKPQETSREYLTIKELQQLLDTECDKMPMLKSVALFSALTGMRFSDIKNLTWNKIRFQEPDSYTIHYRQQKTNAPEILPVSSQAIELLGEKRSRDELVFNGLQYSATIGKIIRSWASDAGIEGKHITFHSFRHTFATLQLMLGTDIYTISKMLGHRELKTTQVYAKIVDKAKHEAASKIKLDFVKK